MIARETKVIHSSDAKGKQPAKTRSRAQFAPAFVKGGHKNGHSRRRCNPATPYLIESIGSSGWTRTSNPPVNSRMLCH